MSADAPLSATVRGVTLAGRSRVDAVAGRRAVIERVEVPPDADVAAVADAYAELGERFLAAGCFEHLVSVAADDSAMQEVFWRLGFGVEQVEAQRDTGRVEPQAAAGVEIRPATVGDVDDFASLTDLVWREAAAAPSWSPFLEEVVAGFPAGHRETIADGSGTELLAVVDERIVGFALWEGDELVVQATTPSLRGRGIGTALFAAGIDRARDAGHTTVRTDWRSANLAADRFWRRRGFVPVRYRLRRTVDPRISWARPSRP